jgi:hypothetical protein
MRCAIAGTRATGFSQFFRVMSRAWLACGLTVLGLCAGPAAALAGVGEQPVAHRAAPTPQGGCCAQFLAGVSSQPEPARYRLAQLSQRPETDATLYVTPAVPTRMGLEKLAGSAGQYKFIMVKGLPPGFVISEGFATSNAWVVSTQDIGNLTITTPDGFKGTVPLTLILYRGQDGQTDQRTIAVSNRPRPQEAATLPDALPTSAPAALGAPALPSADENALMTRAADLMQRGDVAAARLLYQSLAAKGSAQAAFAMGRSYDPDLLKGDAVRRLADVEQARTWYRKATQLGSREAEVRLSTLR